jgi:AraC-like DNA-binding protein
MRRLADPVHEVERIPHWRVPSLVFGAEVFSMRSLRGRVPAEHLGRPHRIEFHLLICVTRGTCTHVVDAQAVPCQAGSVLVCHPGQIEQLDLAGSWEGSIVVFRPEFLFAPLTPGMVSELNLIGILAGLPQHFTLSGPEFGAIRDIFTQMDADSKLNVPAPQINALLRHQIAALLIRLDMAQRQRESRTPPPGSEILRFRRFQQLLNDSFGKWHDVANYAHALGCTEKTLTRTTLSVAGVTAKAFIASRVCVEAKRLLAHTSLSVAAIGERVGFNDASNFVKFFKREAECTPLEFRKHHQPK